MCFDKANFLFGVLLLLASVDLVHAQKNFTVGIDPPTAPPGGSSDCPCIASEIKGKYNCEEDIMGHIKCLPSDYGASFCSRHDLGVHPDCKEEPLPEFCSKSFCFVDFDECKNSKERFFLSDQFPEEKLFYSYSTCNSSEMEWQKYFSTLPIKGKVLQATVPAMWYPRHFKRNATGHVAASSDTDIYYDDSIPWEGYVINYLERVAEVTDIGGFNYTTRTKGSMKKYPNAWTATVSEVSAGVTEMGVSTFWITAERLNLSSFSTPNDKDTIELFVTTPPESNDIADNYTNIFDPFTAQLWGTLAASMILMAVFMVLLADNSRVHTWQDRFENAHWKDATSIERVRIFFAVTLDAMTETFVGFCSQAPIYHPALGFPTKILLVGYAFLVLVSVAAYTANLAAFLSNNISSGTVGTMKEAIRANTPLCAPLALLTDLRQVWPEANFVVSTTNTADTYAGMIENFENGKCTLMVASVKGIKFNDAVRKEFCRLHLVSNGFVVLEKDFAFPIMAEYIAGFSNYLLEAENSHGIHIDDFREEYEKAGSCALEQATNQDGTVEENPQLDVVHFSLPFFILIFFAVVALAVKCFCGKHRKAKKIAHKKMKRRSYNSTALESANGSEIGNGNGNGNVATKLGRLAFLQSQQEYLQEQQEEIEEEQGYLQEQQVSIQKQQGDLLDQLLLQAEDEDPDTKRNRMLFF